MSSWAGKTVRAIGLERETDFVDCDKAGSGNCAVACMDTSFVVDKIVAVALLVFVAVPVALDVVALPYPH